MKHSSSNITYKGVDMYVEFEYNNGYPETRDTPAEPPEFDITSVQIGGIEVITFLNDIDYMEIEQLIINNYEE